jgi:vancomycin resistance protein YoaR
MAISFPPHIPLKKLQKIRFFKKHVLLHTVKVSFWFFWGVVLGFFFFTSFLFIVYQKQHTKTIYTGVFVDGVDFSGKTQQTVQDYFAEKNARIRATKFIFVSPSTTATVSAGQIGFGYDANLLAQQAFSIGRSGNVISDMSTVLQAYLSGIDLPAAYHYSGDKLDSSLASLRKQTDVSPVSGLFTFENGRVTAFKQSSDGRRVDMPALKNELFSKFLTVVSSPSPQRITIRVPIQTVKPEVSTENANSMGIKELVGRGSSLFSHSIENRVYNIGLAASRIHGSLIKPGEVFSFAKAVGDVSSLTGYKQAYVIENGRTVLGDGGGVCQVSTTLFRAALHAGLPIVERHPHAYRVGYYEQDIGAPGIDAAVYVPSVDLKFKNDTGHYLLIQSFFDPANYSLTFEIYGTKDSREVAIGDPVILSQSPAPEPLYQDDPTLPKGEVKQVDFAAAGARVYFTREVKKDGKTLISEKFTSNYQPWRAVFLRGTKE